MTRSTKAELQAENKYLRRNKKASNFALIINNLVRWIGLVAICYLVYRSIDTLAGRSTDAKIGLSLLGDVRFSDAVAAVLGGGGMLYGYAQHRLRRSVIERLQGRIRKYEEMIDNGRTSSGLTTSGDTHPEDL